MALPLSLSLSLFLFRHLNEVGASCHASLAIAPAVVAAAVAADYARGPAKAINMQRKTTTTETTICCTTTATTTTTIVMNIRKFVRQLMAN